MKVDPHGRMIKYRGKNIMGADYFTHASYVWLIDDLSATLHTWTTQSPL